MMRSRNNEAQQRNRERREREDEAPRLHREVPELEALDIEMSSRQPESKVPDSKHVRRVVIQSAPALFRAACTNPACVDGGHDYTHEAMHALRGRQPTFEGEDTCYGTVGTRTCGRVLRFVAHARFAEG